MNRRDPNGEPEGYVTRLDDLQCRASTVLLVREAANLLERHYPGGWLWACQPDERGGVLNLYSMKLSGRWGFTVRILEAQNDPELRAVVRAGGELLERFGYRRGPYNHDQWLAGRRHIGLPAADVSDLSKKMRREFRTDALKEAVQSGRARILTDADIAAARRAAPGAR